MCGHNLDQLIHTNKIILEHEYQIEQYRQKNELYTLCTKFALSSTLLHSYLAINEHFSQLF